jgi:hypothetical protein
MSKKYTSPRVSQRGRRKEKHVKTHRPIHKIRVGESIPEKLSTFICVRFQVLTAASMKMAVFLVVASRRPVTVRFRGSYCHHLQGTHSPHEEGTKNLKSVSKRPPFYTAQHPNRQPSSLYFFCFENTALFPRTL